ncbi:MAG TPA: hypothetical protein VN726_21360 [Hanamia sp.]|nr:hypothetical protein [Hanamia sp.]
MQKLLILILIIAGFSCTKDHDIENKEPEVPKRCGRILMTPTLDSFIYPTYYISATIEFNDGKEVLHVRGNVTGDHDGSWFTSKYDKDSILCAPIKAP